MTTEPENNSHPFIPFYQFCTPKSPYHQFCCVSVNFVYTISILENKKLGFLFVILFDFWPKHRSLRKGIEVYDKMVSNGSPLDCLGLKPVGANNDNGSVKDHADDDKQKTLFYQLLTVNLKENCSQGNGQHEPVLLGDGQVLDLYKLFSLVKDNGGYAAVSKKGLWGYVTEKLGLDLQVLVSVRIAYGRYLKDFEEKIFRNGDRGCVCAFKPLSLELEKELSGLVCPNLKEKDDELVELELKKIINDIDLVNHKNETNLLDTKNQDTMCEDVGNVLGDVDKKLCNGVNDDRSTFDTEVAVNHRKRKRESLSGMINWMKHIANHPLDPLIPPIPKPSKWKEYKGHDFFFQVLRTREVLSLQGCVEPKGGPASLQKMHPSMYENEVAPGHHSTVKLRCSGRVHTSVKSRFCSCCNSGSANGNRLRNPVITKAEKCPPEETTEPVDLLAEEIMADQSGDEFSQRKVSIGPAFQAEVPEWTGVVSESDPKWLGTVVWPSERDSKPATETDLIGRGREDKCSCELQGSVDCVRYHIAESRMKLKRELGPAFYHWGFDRMGEEVSLQWTTVEEKRFKDLMRLQVPIENKSFWTNSSRYFPNKTRKNLVSYYYDEFVVQRRIFQNRVIPKNIDSDNDEVEFGSFGDGFGMELLMDPDTDFMDCSENKQVTDADGFGFH